MGDVVHGAMVVPCSRVPVRVQLDSERVQQLRKPMKRLHFMNYHQQHLEKNPGGCCGLSGTGVSCPMSAGPHEDSE